MSAFDKYIAAEKAGGAVASVAPGTAVTAAKVLTGSPFDKYIANGGTTTPAMTPVPSASQHPLRWFGAQLAKPGNILANITEPIGKAIVSGDTSGFKTMPKNVWDIATGKSTRGYMEMTQEALPDNPIIGTVAGLGLSILADPLNVIGGGLTKVGRVAEILSKAEKAGIAIKQGSKVAKDLEKIGISVATANDLLRTRKAGVAIEKGSKLAKNLEKAGVTAEQLALAGTKVAQAAAGQRAFLKAGEFPLMSQKASESAYKATGAVAEALKASRPVSAVRGLFSTSTGNKAADLAFQGAKNFERYLEGKGFEEATQLRKDLNKVIKNQEEIIQFSNYLEKNIEPANSAIKPLAERAKKLYNQYVKSEQMVDLPTRQHPNYVPHIPIPEKMTARDVFSSKLWSTKVKAAESRDIIKFVSEHGREQIGTAKSLGLKPVDSIKGLNQAITWGEFKSIKDIEKTLSHWGITLEFKPQRILRGNALGYFDPSMKKIVIAARRPSLGDVLGVVRHEITHSAHFQIAGNIDMMETMAKAGRSLRWTTALNTTKDAVKKDWEVILLKTEGITPEMFKVMPPNKQEYYTKPTELMARVGSEIMKDPVAARAAFPDSITAFEKLRRENDLFDLVYTNIPTEGYKITGDIYRNKAGVLHQAIESGVEKAGIEETKKAFGKPFFVEDPAFQLAWRAKVNAKAVASAKLFQDIKQFSIPDGIEVKVPELKGFRFDPQIAKQLDAYHTAIQPEEINMMFKSFDKVQNWWKGQALLSPAYHLRNMAGNFWNNFLAGIWNPQAYVDADKIQKGKAFEMVDDFGRKWTGPQILEESKRTGVVGHGQFKADIEQTIENEITSGNWNPFSQGNKVFRFNRKVGGTIEDNARLTNFMHQLKKGLSPGEAAMEVKKYLFDYEDLTSFERNVMKRFMPFYTFTRKNLPLQFENVVKQPGKFSSLERFMQGIESLGMRNAPPANEKYLSDYIKNNTAMKVNYNSKDKSYNYLLLGNWLPAYQAFDFISQPTENMMGMITPIFKTPGELMFNKSSFWKTTLDEAQDIEKFPGEKINFLGFNITKKTATFLKNFRILNDIDKANPGLIFGGTKGQQSIFAKAGLPGVSLPLFGNVTPAQYKYTASGNVPGGVERTSRLFVGSQLASYKPSTAREFYNRDTDARITEYKTAIRDAAKSGDTERVKLITKQMSDFIKERGR